MTDATLRPTTAWRRWLRLVALAVAAGVGLAAAFVAYDRWRQRRAWDEACAEADRLDRARRWSFPSSGR